MRRHFEGHDGQRSYLRRVGLFVSTIGMDIVTGYPRFTFGNANLLSGVSFIPAMIGLFGIPVVLRTIMTPRHLDLPGIAEKKRFSISEMLPTVFKNRSLVLRSSVMGTFIGSLPGAGADIAAWWHTAWPSALERAGAVRDRH